MSISETLRRRITAGDVLTLAEMRDLALDVACMERALDEMAEDARCDERARRKMRPMSDIVQEIAEKVRRHDQVLPRPDTGQR